MTEKILDSGGQTENCRSLSPLLEALFLAFLTPCPSVSLFDHVVATHCGDHLLVVDGDHAREFPDGRLIAAELAGMNGLWEIGFIQEPDQERIRGLGIAAVLEDAGHETVLVHSTPSVGCH